MRTRLHSYAALSMVMLLAVSACSTSSPSASTPAASAGESSAPAATSIKLGFLSPMTGDAAFWGLRGKEAVQLAVDEVNAAGGINGAQVTVDYQDTRGDKTEVANVMKRFAGDPSITAVIGSVLSGDMFVQGPIAQQDGITICGYGTTASGIPAQGSYVFRVAATSELGIPALLEYAQANKGIKSVAILYSLNNDYSVDAAETWESSAEALGLNVVAVETYNDKDVDFSAQISKIAAAKPDALILAGYTTEGSLAAIEARKQGLDVPLLAGDGMGELDTLSKVGGTAVDGLLLFGGFDKGSTDPKAVAFTDVFTKRFGHDPEAAAGAAYDVAGMVLAALKTSGADRAKFRDAFAATKDYVGVQGPISFDANREVLMSAFILEYNQGVFNLLAVQKPS